MNILFRTSRHIMQKLNIKNYSNTTCKHPVAISYYPSEKQPQFLDTKYAYYPSEKIVNYTTNIDYQYHLRVYNQTNSYNLPNRSFLFMYLYDIA